MKKWIGIYTAFFLALIAAPTFANHIQPVDPKEIANPEARQHFELGVQAFMNHDFDEAARHFQAAEVADPEIPEIHLDLAMALAADGRTDMARKHFDEATNLIAQAGPPPEMLPQG